MREIELKFKITDISEIREKIKDIGAQKVGRAVERDVGFDNKKKLKQKGELLRLRRKDGEVYLTFKSPKSSDDFKEMEEIELEIDDFDKMKEILKRMGFTPQRGFEKDRETWHYKESEILIDRLGFGNFLEVEGNREEIKEIADQLDLNWSERITDNYLQVYQKYCKKKGIKEEKFF